MVMIFVVNTSELEEPHDCFPMCIRGLTLALVNRSSLQIIKKKKKKMASADKIAKLKHNFFFISD